MKRFFKLFMAVAAVAGVIACTTDATEDLGVNLNGGQTTLTLSLDDTRTQLGVKGEGETTYPLTWAAGDAISVNGSVSNALAADEAGATTATFTFNSGFGSAPYFIAYPATSTNNQVVFAAEQTHTSNTTFGNGAAVMYCYTTDLSSVKLNHLTGVLKIGVVSDNEETLKSVRISTVDRKPIAGAFNVDAEGKLTPVNGATSDVITYTFSEGVDLTAEPTYIHVAVPAGVYGELYVTLEAETEKEEVMGVVTKAIAYSYKIVTTDSTKPINAGTVREFTNNLTFEPADETTNYVIATYDDLKKFKTAVEGGDTRNAVLVNDIEVSDDWASIDAAAYTATFNGNGYAIKGLKAPLFNATAATIKGVHLKGVAIASDYASANTGALVNTYTGASISHCSAEGTITLTRETSVANKIGGLVGYVSNTTSNWAISDCVNNCAITVNLTQGATSVSTWVGGLVGDSYSGTPSLKVITIKNNTNKGAILVTGNTNATLVVGGVISRVNNYEATTSTTTKTTAVFTNCSNSANLSANLGTSAAIHMAGILAYDVIGTSGARYYTSATDCYNSGKIEVNLTGDSTATGISCIGGCFGNLQHLHGCNVTLKNCDNSGDVVATSTGSIAGEYHIAGVAAYFYGRITVSNCDNTGKSVKFNANTITGISSVGGVVGFGAVRAAGYAGSVNIDRNAISLSKCTNSADVLLDVQQTMSKKAFVGGVIGLTYAHTSTVSTLSFTELGNYGSITVDVPSSTSTTPLTFVGGVMGSNWLDNSHSTSTTSNVFKITDCTNGEANTDKKIVIKGADNAANAVDGVMGYKDTRLTKTTVEGCTNNMVIEYNSATE